MSERDYIYPFPGRSQRLGWPVEESDVVVATRVALDAVDVLRSAWEPLSVEAILYKLEGDDPLTWSSAPVAQPHRLLVRTSIDAGVTIDSLMTDPVVTSEAELSRQVIDTWLAGALRDVATSDAQHGEWQEIFLHACRAWVGPPGWRSGETALHLRHEASLIEVPLERAPSGVWLSGPRKPASDQSPLAVRLSNQSGFLTLRLTRNYSYWLDSAERAAQRLDELVDRLRGMGWEDER